MSLDPTSPLPLYVQLIDALRHRLRAGEWRSGDPLPSEAELGEAYGVSRITVIRAMSELVREGLVHRQRGRRTVAIDPSPAAASPIALAFLAPRLESDRLLRIYHSFEDTTASSGGYAILAGLHGEGTAELHRVRSLLAGPVRGLALGYVSIPPSDRPFWQALPGRGIPYTFVGSYQPDLSADRVVADNVAAGAIATRHLLTLGHRRIAFLVSSPSQLQAGGSFLGRLNGYQQALVDAGVDLGDDASRRGWVLDTTAPPGLPDGARRELLLNFLERTSVTAAVTCNDQMAVLVQRYLDTASIRVPDDLALVGITDEPMAALADVPLTSVRIDAAALGRAAADQLLRRLGGETGPPQEFVVPVSLTVRASCGAAAQASDLYSPEDAVREAEELLHHTAI